MAWEKNDVTFGRKRICFDQDYSLKTIQQSKAYVYIKKVLKREGICYQTLFNKMHIHWPGVVRTYGYVAT